MSRYKIVLITILMPISVLMVYIITGLTSNIINVLLVFLLPIIILFSVIWIIFLIYKVRHLKFLLIPLILISLIPILDIIFGLRYKIVEMFKSKLVFEAICDAPISSCKLTLRENNRFELKNGSLIGFDNYSGNYKVINDTIILNFRGDKPDFIKEYNSMWIIDRQNKIVSYKTTGMTFKIIENNINK